MGFKEVVEGFFSLGPENLQGWRLHILSGHLMPLLGWPGERFLLISHPDLLIHLLCIASLPPTTFHRAWLHLLAAPSQVLGLLSGCPLSACPSCRWDKPCALRLPWPAWWPSLVAGCERAPLAERTGAGSSTST